MIFPSKFIKAGSCTITSKTTTEQTKYGFVSQKGKRGDPHEWRIEFMTAKMYEEDIRELIALIDSFDGRYENFTLPCPLRFMSSNSSFSVSDDAFAGQNTISVAGLNANTVGALKAGDFIKFDNHPKCYKIAFTTDSDAGGNATLQIYPRLFKDVSTGDTITEAVFTCEMQSDNNTSILDAKSLRHSQLVQVVEA